MAQKLALQWSPEQISGWLKQQFPTDRDMRISHEAIYRSLFVQTRGVLKKELGYFPRGTDLSRFSQAYLNGIALRLNQRPRKTLAFETPANRLQLVLH